MMKTVYSSILFFLASVLSLAAQGNIVLKGKVMDSADGYPLIGVSVIVEVRYDYRPGRSIRIKYSETAMRRHILLCRI